MLLKFKEFANASHVRPTRALCGRMNPSGYKSFMAGNYAETTARG
jgi:hypothetical protein